MTFLDENGQDVLWRTRYVAGDSALVEKLYCTCLAPGMNYCEMHEGKIYESEKMKMNKLTLAKEGAEATIARATRDIERAERKLAMLEKVGEDVYVDEDVLVFYKKFSGGDNVRTYTYSAIKLGNWWFLSGPSQAHNKYDWGGLVEFIVVDNCVEELVVWHATGWERVL